MSISSDSARNMSQLKQKHQFDITFVSDPGAKLAKKYEVSMYEQLGESKLKALQALPSKFLINSDGKIKWKYLAESKLDRPSIDQIEGALEAYL